MADAQPAPSVDWPANWDISPYPVLDPLAFGEKEKGPGELTLALPIRSLLAWRWKLQRAPMTAFSLAPATILSGSLVFRSISLQLELLPRKFDRRSAVFFGNFNV